MAETEEERELRLRPRKPRLSGSGRAGWSSGFRLLMHYARSTTKNGIRRAHAGEGKTVRPYHQRCAVRVTYLNNQIRGQWKAHGRYLARESAVHGSHPNSSGFSCDNEAVDVASKLDVWQKGGDQRLWKLIVSPEFGEKVDLTRLTRDLMQRMKTDLGTNLEWIGVEHCNTEHPHVHVVVRGLRDDGEVLRMSRQYVQQGIRATAEHLCTRQLGYRTQLDASEAEWREITEQRFTYVDRRIMREASEVNPEYFSVVRNSIQTASSDTVRLCTQHEIARLAVLQRMGLAENAGAGTWLVRRDFEQVLRAMQRAADRQKTLAAHGALISDESLPVEALDLSQMTTVEGRVLVHGQDEQSGRNYLMLEGTDAKVYFVYYTREMEQARSRGELRTNSFVRCRELAEQSAPSQRRGEQASQPRNYTN
jgi:type IV secretory pathway VirD2 relaxase